MLIRVLPGILMGKPVLSKFSRNCSKQPWIYPHVSKPFVGHSSGPGSVLDPVDPSKAGH